MTDKSSGTPGDPLPSTDFTGQVVVVTGAAGALGSAYAVGLAERGAHVVLGDLDGEAAERISASLSTRGLACTSDVADPAGGERLVEAALSEFGRLDAVVANAGTWRNAPVEEITDDLLDPVLDVHVRGAFHLARAAWPVFVRNGGGRIVLTGSGAGAFGRSDGANYCAAKAAVQGLTRALAIEGEAHGIRANCLLPVADAKRSRRASAAATLTAERIRGLFDRLGADRADPRQVLPMLLVLASAACPVNGELFSAAGGRYARVVTAVTTGIVGPAADPISPEELLRRFDEVRALDGVTVPASVLAEIEAVVDRVAAGS